MTDTILISATDSPTGVGLKLYGNIMFLYHLDCSSNIFVEPDGTIVCGCPAGRKWGKKYPGACFQYTLRGDESDDTIMQLAAWIEDWTDYTDVKLDLEWYEQV